MNVNFVTSLIWQKHKSWSEIGSNIVAATKSTFALRSLGLGGANPLAMLTNIAIGSIWSINILDTVYSIRNSVLVLKYAASRLNWVFTIVPVKGDLAALYAEQRSLKQQIETFDQQWWETITAQIQDSGLKNSLKRIWSRLDTRAIEQCVNLGVANRQELSKAFKGYFGIGWIADRDIDTMLIGLQKTGWSLSGYIRHRRYLEDKQRVNQVKIVAGSGNPADRAVIAGVNRTTMWMIAGSAMNLTTSLFTALGIVFSLSHKAYTKEEFANLQFGGAKPEEVVKACGPAMVGETIPAFKGASFAQETLEDAQLFCERRPRSHYFTQLNEPEAKQHFEDLCTNPALAQTTWQRADSYVSFAFHHAHLIGVLIRMASDFKNIQGTSLKAKGLNFLKQKMPYYLFSAGWFGMVPGNTGQYLLMAPLAAKCAYHTLFPEANAASDQDALDMQSPDPKNPVGMAAKFVFDYYLPHWFMQIRIAMLQNGYSYLSSILKNRAIFNLAADHPLSGVGQRGFKCSVFERLHK